MIVGIQSLIILKSIHFDIKTRQAISEIIKIQINNDIVLIKIQTNNDIVLIKIQTNNEVVLIKIQINVYQGINL